MSDTTPSIPERDEVSNDTLMAAAGDFLSQALDARYDAHDEAKATELLDQAAALYEQAGSAADALVCHQMKEQ